MYYEHSSRSYTTHLHASWQLRLRRCVGCRRARRVHLEVHVLSCRDGGIAGRLAGRSTLSRRQPLDERVGVGAREVDNGEARTRARCSARAQSSADGRRRRHPVWRRAPPVIGPSREQVPNVDRQCSWRCRHRLPMPRGHLNLEAATRSRWILLSLQDREPVVVGVGAIPGRCGGAVLSEIARRSHGDRTKIARRTQRRRKPNTGRPYAS